MRLLRVLLIPALGVLLAVVILGILNPGQAMRDARAQAQDLATRAAMAGAECIDESDYARTGAFTGMPLDAACAREEVLAIAPAARVDVQGGVITVAVDIAVRLRGIQVPGLSEHARASAHAEYLDGT